MTLDDAEAFALVAQGWPRFRGEQIWRWVHHRRCALVRRDDEPVRATCARSSPRRDASARLEVAEVQTSSDGTRKLRLVTHDGQSIESVIIPDGDKTTQCISSQVGCAVDCQFCATAKLGLVRNLDAGEIVDQVYLARRLLAEVDPGRRLTNLVYMGMGEPLHNYDNVVAVAAHPHARQGRRSCRSAGSRCRRRGSCPSSRSSAREDVRPNLAVSLNAPNDAIRDEIMPINRKWNIGSCSAALRAYPLEQRRRITFEYVLLAGVNDSLARRGAAREAAARHEVQGQPDPVQPAPRGAVRAPGAAVIDAFQSGVQAARAADVHAHAARRRHRCRVRPAREPHERRAARTLRPLRRSPWRKRSASCRRGRTRLSCTVTRPGARRDDREHVVGAELRHRECSIVARGALTQLIGTALLDPRARVASA